MAAPIRVVFPLFPGVTQLDFTGPHQVFARTPGAEVIVASLGGQDIACEGFTFSGLADLAQVEACDVICIPGGGGASRAALDEAFVAEVRRLAAGARYVSSVCTGALVLGGAGLLQGRRAATHWAWRELLAPFGATVDEARVVRDGNIFTGGGVTAGIDVALTLVAEMTSPEIAQGVQLAIEYAPDPPFNSGRPELAAPQVLAAVKANFAKAAADRRAEVEEAARRVKQSA